MNDGAPFFRHIRTLFYLIWVTFLFLPQGVIAGEAQNGNAYLRGIAKRYEAVQFFRAKFVQVSKAPGVVKNERASGIVYLRKDGKFRWDYDQPDIVLIISDGKTLWIYQPEDKQVMVDRTFRRRMKRFPYTFLKGMGNLERDFTARVLRQTGETVTLILNPKRPIKEIKAMEVTFNPHTFLIHRISWTSSQGVKTIISFKDIDITSKIPESIFRFEPPPGVDIVDANAP